MTGGQLKAQMRFVQLKRLKRLQTGFVVAAVIFVAEVALSAVAVAKADDPGHRGLLQRKSEKLKNIVTRRVHVLHLASPSQSLGPTNRNNLTGRPE